MTLPQDPLGVDDGLDAVLQKWQWQVFQSPGVSALASPICVPVIGTDRLGYAAEALISAQTHEDITSFMSLEENVFNEPSVVIKKGYLVSYSLKKVL